jgi:hypothetical protein
MSDISCLEEHATARDVRLNEEEVVALFMNLIAFDGDWTAHLRFLNGLGRNHALRSRQIPHVREMQRKDLEFDIQTAIRAM